MCLQDTQEIGAGIAGNTTPAIGRCISCDRRNTNRAMSPAKATMTAITGVAAKATETAITTMAAVTIMSTIARNTATITEGRTGTATTTGDDKERRSEDKR